MIIRYFVKMNKMVYIKLFDSFYNVSEIKFMLKVLIKFYFM